MILLEVAVNLFTRTWFRIRSVTSARQACRKIAVLSLIRSQRQLACERLYGPKTKTTGCRKEGNEKGWLLFSYVSQFLLFCALQYSLQPSETVPSQVGCWLEKSKFYSERPQGAGFRSVNPAERWRENPARALARAGFSQHLECGIHQSESSPEGSFALIPRPVARWAKTTP